MRLSCQKGFILAVVSTLACHEATAPPISNSYLLESINSQPIPANIEAEAGDTITVLYSILLLDGAGNAQLTEQIRYVHPNSPPGQATYTTGYSYSITRNPVLGQSIVFESPPCLLNALCAAPPQGRFVGSKLILSYGPSSASRPPSVYRPITLVD